MRTVTATEASRSFAALLDEVENLQSPVYYHGLEPLVANL